mmetsp:Transcript_766/g.1819  ORF Transcript_766/g.1819 Transcript_766/m.1819 type:complete len:218 (-) Transcript_766:907-1560(-)
MSAGVTRGLEVSEFLAARIWSHASTAHMPSFSRMWLLPVPKDSSPQMKGVYLAVSMRLPKNFQPVGVSKKGMFLALHTRSRAHDVGMLRATPLSPPLPPKRAKGPFLVAKYGMSSQLSTSTARESEGVTKNLLPRIMFLSASPSAAAPRTGGSSACPVMGEPSLATPIRSHSSRALARLGSACPCEGQSWPPKSSLGSQFMRELSGAPRISQKTFLA